MSIHLVDTRESQLVFGTTSLLHEFLSFAFTSCYGGRMDIAVPFADGGFTTVWSSNPLLDLSEMDIRIVLKNRESATCVLKEFRSMSPAHLQISIQPSLHAKIYTVTSDKGNAAILVGSHNLTSAGILRNLEAGVYYRTTCGNHQVQTAINAAREFIGAINSSYVYTSRRSNILLNRLS